MSENPHFSYVSPEKQRRFAVRLLAIELVVLLLAGIIILFFLNYLGMVPLFRYSPRIFGWLPVQPGVQKGIPVNPNEPIIQPTVVPDIDNNVDESIQPELLVVSEIEDYRIRTLDRNELLNYLRGFNVWGREYLTKDLHESGRLRKLVIHLTDEPQPLNKDFRDGIESPTLSSNIKFTGDTCDLYVHIDSKKLQKIGLEPELLFEEGVITALYRMSYDPKGMGINVQKENELAKILSEKSERKKVYTEITKL